jgi:hypothetical protein
MTTTAEKPKAASATAEPHPMTEKLTEALGQVTDPAAVAAINDAIERLNDPEANKGPRGQLESSIAYSLFVEATAAGAKNPPDTATQDVLNMAAQELRVSVDPERQIKEDQKKAQQNAPKTHEERITALEEADSPPPPPPSTAVATTQSAPPARPGNHVKSDDKKK